MKTLHKLFHKAIDWYLRKYPDTYKEVTRKYLVDYDAIPLINQEYGMVPDFQIHDLVKHQNGTEIFCVVGTYYDEDLQARLFVKDFEGKIFSVASNFYNLVSDPGVITNAVN